MKKSKIPFFIMPVLAMSLTSCFGGIGVVGTITKYEGYFQTDTYSLHMRDVHYSNWRNTLKPIGNQKILVIPVAFKDGPTWTEPMLERLETAFFGTSAATAWESVASYYEKSSYGQLHLSGTIASPITFTAMSVGGASAAFSSDISFMVAESVYNSGYISNDVLKANDQDRDGHVDAVCFIYSNAYDEEDFWAWVGWTGSDPNPNKPTFNTHMWASYDFMSDGYGDAAIDAHTFIHETGHMLGLDDYYPYDNNYAASGRLDMMDYNILDHNAYSKMLLEWIQPYVVDGSQDETIIELNPFESSGDCIIINDRWNGSPLDEYLAIEFYTPTGLNAKDSEAAYPDSGLQGFTIPGVKIYHVDSRLARLDIYEDRWGELFLEFNSYVTSRPSYNLYYYDIAASNTNRWTYTAVPEGTFKLLHLMEATGINSFKNNGTANNNTLFTTGDTFRASSTFFENGTHFNNGAPVGYEIEIGEITSEKAEIIIRAI